MSRRLPTTQEAAQILTRKRTRPAHRAAPTAGRQMAKLIKALDEKFGQGTGALAARWREIVGETLAKRTEPSKLTKPRSGGAATLEIRVDGPAAALIQHQSAEILDRVNLFLGKGAVEKLRIVQGPVKARAGAAAPKRPRTQPMDAAAEAALRDSLKTAPDGDLKSALERLGRGALRDR
jgi:hypothetical protein